MKGKHASQTLKRLAKDLASHPILLFLAFLGTIAQVAPVYLFTNLDWTSDRPSLSRWIIPAILADFPPDDLGGDRKYTGTMGQSPPIQPPHFLLYQRFARKKSLKSSIVFRLPL